MHKTHTRFLAAVTALLIPCTAMAAVLLDVPDSVAGVGLTVTMEGARAGDSLDIVVNDPDGQSIRIPVQADAHGAATAVLPGTKAQTAGTYDVSARRGTSSIGNAVKVHVTPDSMDARMSDMQVRTSVIAADGRDEAIVDVTLRDRYGNVLENRPVALIASRTADTVTPLSAGTDDTGTQSFAVRTTQEGIIQLRAMDLLSTVTLAQSAEVRAGAGYGMGGTSTYTASTYMPTSQNVSGGKTFYFNAQVTDAFDILDHFEVTAPAQMNLNEAAIKITVRAVDRNGNTVENYTGTVRFSTTDPDATVPNFGTYEFRDRDLGEKSFPLALTFRTAGLQTLRVEDSTNPDINGTADISVGGQSGNGGSIDITSHSDGDMVNSLEIVVAGLGPRFANLIVMGGAQDAYGATDDRGSFSIPVTLAENQHDFTIRVRDDAGRNDSGQIHLILDQDAPTIDLIQFAPEEPEEGEKVLVVVQSEPELAQAVLRIPDRVNGVPDEVPLIENPSQPGSYQGFFTAPAADIYQPTATVMDRAGNVTELSAQFIVGSDALAKVLNVKAQPKVDAVELTWDPLGGVVSGYRIYIGDSTDNFLYTLDTGKVITKATVKGLTQGQEYTFAVTALQGDKESAEKSDPVQARVLGFKLEVVPGDGALQVTWTSLASDLPLSSFILEYGISADALTESRMLNGDLRDTTIRDLLNGVPYFVKITPVTVTGDKLDELSASGEGIPDGSGFKPGARDDVPFDIKNLPSGPLHSGAPESPSSGIPTNLLLIALAVGVAGVYLRWKHRTKMQQTAAFLQAIQTHYNQF